MIPLIFFKSQILQILQGACKLLTTTVHNWMIIYCLLRTFCQQKSMYSPQSSMKHWPGQQQSLWGHPAEIALPPVEHTFLSRAGTNTFTLQLTQRAGKHSSTLAVRSNGRGNNNIPVCDETRENTWWQKALSHSTHYNRNRYTPILFLHQHDLIHFRRFDRHSSI